MQVARTHRDPTPTNNEESTSFGDRITDRCGEFRFSFENGSSAKKTEDSETPYLEQIFSLRPRGETARKVIAIESQLALCPLPWRSALPSPLRVCACERRRPRKRDGRIWSLAPLVQNPSPITFWRSRARPPLCAKRSGQRALLETSGRLGERMGRRAPTANPRQVAPAVLPPPSRAPRRFGRAWRAHARTLRLPRPRLLQPGR